MKKIDPKNQKIYFHGRLTDWDSLPSDEQDKLLIKWKLKKQKNDNRENNPEAGKQTAKTK